LLIGAIHLLTGRVTKDICSFLASDATEIIS
jgi:hypothetical protein